MAIVSPTKIYSFVENLGKNVGIDLSGTLTVALTNTAHTTTWDELADLTQISYTNLSSRDILPTSWSQTSGTAKLVLPDLTITASGAVPAWRYVYLYDDKSTNDKLILYYDYGSSVVYGSGDSFVLDFSQTSGVITIA
jgi:hypothetical protein